MEIKFRNRPSDELIKRYCKKIEEYLSAHALSIKIELFDTPNRIDFYLNDELSEKKMLWIKRVVINSQATGEMKIKGLRIGIDDNISDHEIWTDAWSIQNQIYKQNKIEFDPNNRDDLYWRLWDYLKNKKE